MRNKVLLFLVGILVLSCTSNDPQKNINEIDKLIEELVEDKRAVGITYAIQVGDSILQTKEFGVSNIEMATPITQETQFRIASVTKPITAIAIMQLIEAKKLSLQDTIDKFFQSFPNGNQITVYQLLSHTSGIPNWWVGGMPKDEPKNFPLCENPHQYLERMNTPSLFEPGTFYSYSNSNYVLLGEITEIVSGQSYESFIKENIFIPANMENTEMEYAIDAKQTYAKGYTWQSNEENPFGTPESYTMPFSAGGLRSTTKDLLHFANAFGNGKLVRKETLLMMTSYAKLKNGKPVYEGLYSPSGQTPKFPGNMKNVGYGLGFQLIENFGTKTISHGGDIAGFNAVFMCVPKSNTTLVILANTENGVMSKLREIDELVTRIE